MQRRSEKMSFRFATVSLAILFGTILASGCLFQPRDPEPPSEDNVPWLNPVLPENVLANMKSALETLTSTNYNNSIWETFVFLPSGQDVSQAENQGSPGYYEEFGKIRELDALGKLYTQVDTLRVEWNDSQGDWSIAGDIASVELHNYEFHAVYVTGETRVYEGSAVLSFQEEGGQWYLAIWDEEDNATEQSWGRLRLDLDV